MSLEQTPSIGQVENGHVWTGARWTPIEDQPPPPNAAEVPVFTTAPVPPATLLPAPPQPKSSGAKYIVIVLVAVLAAAILGLVVSHVRASESGLNNPDVLAQNMQHYLNQRLAEKNSSVTATSVLCVPTDTAHQFKCNIEGSDGSHYTVNTTVSPDGKTWVTDN